MPELPEVETVVRDLGPHLCGRTIISVRMGRKRLRQARSDLRIRDIVGRRVTALCRRGKYILINLEKVQLVIHLGMTGQLTIGPADRPVERHTHFVAMLNDGSELRFRDVRRFGSIVALANEASLQRFLSARLGPEPFAIDTSTLHSALGATTRSLKAILLDQRVIAGVGNIYADESLFVARLAPTRTGRSITRSEAERLRAALAGVLQRAIDQRGSTIRDFVDGSGLNGSYQGEFRCYGRTRQPCLRCSTPILRIRLAGRSTHFCPKCQPSQPRRLVRPAAAKSGTVW